MSYYSTGVFGDHIGSLVAVKYITEQYKWITLLVYVPDYLKDFTKYVLPETSIFSFSEMRFRYDPTKPTKTTKWDGILSPMKIHTVDYAFLKLTDENPSIEHKNYLQIGKNIGNNFNLPENYVVITTGYTADVREFLASEINKIVDYLLTKKITTVFLGQTQTKTGAAHIIKGTFKDDINFNAGINLIDKTSLLEAASIMQGAKAVLGVDNGLMHLAGCTDVPIIGGFTTVSPEIRMPYRHNQLGWNFYPVRPDESLGCRFCQQKTNFLYGHDYRNCMNKHTLCVTQMTAEKFIKHLEEII